VYTYQLQPRKLTIEKGAVPVFPCEVECQFLLSPAAVLGDGKGPFPIVVSGEPFGAVYDSNTGRVVYTPSIALPAIDIRVPLRGGELHLNRGEAVYRYVAQSLDELVERMNLLRLALPAALALYIPVPLVPTSTLARTESDTLRSVLVKVNSPISWVTADSYVGDVVKALNALEVAITPPDTSLLVALRYLHTASRLSQIGSSPWEFTAEILLNCAKTLEVLFSSQRDDIRVGARALGYSDDEIEGVFMSLMVLRNSLDVGHAKSAILPTSTLQSIYEFVALMPAAVQELTQRAIEARATGTWHPPEVRQLESSEDEKSMRRLLASMQRGTRARQTRVAAGRSQGHT
jgi:hypothetical protein